MIDFYMMYDPQFCGAAVHCGDLVAKIRDSNFEARKLLEQLIQHSTSQHNSSYRDVTVNAETLGLFGKLVELLKPVQ